MSTQPEALSTRARHTKLALSKALNVTITRAPPQASVRKMLARSKTAKRRLSGGGAAESADLSDLLPGLLDADDGATSRADDALAQVVLGVCEDVETHFEALAEETYVNGEFANLDAWIQEAQENVLRKRARSDSEHKTEGDNGADDTAGSAGDALSPELLVLAERQRVVDDELRALETLREQKAAQLTKAQESVKRARREAVVDVERAQSAVATVDSVRDLVTDFATA